MAADDAPFAAMTRALLTRFEANLEGSVT